MRIVGGWFRDRLALSNGRLHRQLWLDFCRFDEGIDFYGQRIDGPLSLLGSFVTTSVHNVAAIDLTVANVEGQLNLTSATVTGRLTMNGLQIGQLLRMAEGSFADVDLIGAHIKDQLSLISATVTGRLAMNTLQVGRSLLMRGSENKPACLAEIDLTASAIGANLFLTRTTLTGDIHLQYAQISGGLYLSSANFAKKSAKVDLLGAKITGELRLTDLQWAEDSCLSLSAASALVLHEDCSWPRHLELYGFTYDRIGGVGESLDRERFHQRYLGGWLERDNTYTPQPYEQLANVFRKTGEPERASDILYASRERAREKATSWRYLGMTLLKWTIGYGLGYRYFRCLSWIGGFTAFGAVIVYVGGINLLGGGNVEPADCVVYSSVKLLPFAKFDEFKEIALATWAKWYFDFHQLVGYVLAGFLAAGLAGLTPNGNT